MSRQTGENREQEGQETEGREMESREQEDLETESQEIESREQEDLETEKRETKNREQESRQTAPGAADNQKESASWVMLELLEDEGGVLRLDGSVPPEMAPKSLTLKLNGENLPVSFTERFAQAEVGGKVFSGCKAFFAEISVERFQKNNILTFVRTDHDGREENLSVVSTCYQARLYSGLKQGWWHFGQYLVTLAGVDSADCRAAGIRISRKGRIGFMRQELCFLKEILCASYGSRKMFLMRLMYWILGPFYCRKNIWVTFDKLYKGGDCGEYFYKYISGRKDDGICPVYVIKKGVPDYERLCREGYQPAVYRSWKQRMLYLYASMVFGTHSGVPSFCGFNQWEVRFVQDRFRAVNLCIQHGLSVQDLRADSNRVINNNKRYYCASRYEVENLSKPAYDYRPEVLRLTGIPRYDGLVSQDERQILITPTWRSYLAMHSVMGQARPYNPEFKNTEYYRIFQALVEHEKLGKTAQQMGYRIVYLLHPVISAQKKDFRPAGGVEILSALESDYEELLTQSSLMVTDYSGVQFDFAYMRKPVVYFHPPELPPHYEEGGFFYETQGFGEICTDIDELADMLCDYMRNGCQLKDFYRARQDDFFAYEDFENCRRIYEDARCYQESFVESIKNGHSLRSIAEKATIKK